MSSCEKRHFTNYVSYYYHIIAPDLSIDAMDVSGEQQIDMSTNLLKQRLDTTGTPLDESPQKESE